MRACVRVRVCVSRSVYGTDYCERVLTVSIKIYYIQHYFACRLIPSNIHITVEDQLIETVRPRKTLHDTSHADCTKSK